MEELIIDRTKGNEEISNQIDISANEFQGLEENKEVAIGAEEEAIPDHLKEAGPFCERQMDVPRKEERPRMERREKDAPWEFEMDLSGVGGYEENYVKIATGRYKRSELGGFRRSQKSKKM